MKIGSLFQVNVKTAWIYFTAVMWLCYTGCSPLYYRTLNTEHAHSLDSFARTDTIIVKDHVVFSSSYDACNFFLDEDSLMTVVKAAFSQLDIPIKFMDHGSNQKEGVFNTSPNHFLGKLEAPRHGQVCSVFRPDLKYEYINTGRIMELAHGVNDRHTHILIPIIIPENSAPHCEESLFNVSFDCERGISQDEVSIHLGVFMVQGPKIVYFSSIGFYNRADMDGRRPTQKQWNRAVQMAMKNYMQNLK